MTTAKFGLIKVRGIEKAHMDAWRTSFIHT